MLNPGHGNDWITLKLEERKANRAAIGARIEVRLDGRSGIRKLHRTVGSGGSFGASSLQQEIGLGRMDADGGRIEEIKITWPDRARTVQALGSLAPNAAYLVREGEPAARLQVERLHLKRADELTTAPVGATPAPRPIGSTSAPGGAGD